MKIQASIFYSLLGLIIFVAILIRFTALGQFPPAMLPDEAALGYNAMSIAQTGKDEWSISWPLAFHSFGDDKPPAFVYATSLVYLVTGWTPVLPRITSALAGLLTVLFLTLWLRNITKSDLGALTGGLIAAVSPWTVHLSRSALESNLGLFGFIFGLYFFEKTKQRHSRARLIFFVVLSSLGFILSTYSFHSYRLVTPVYLGVLALIEMYALWKRNAFRKIFSSPILYISAATCILVLPGLLYGSSTTRFSQTTLYQPVPINSIMALNRDTCHEMSTQLQIPYLSRACQLVWNRPTIYANLLYRSFLLHLQPTFIFIEGDRHFAQNPMQVGLLFAYLLPVFAVGLYQSIKKRGYYFFLFVGYVVAITPSALTGPIHATRLSPLIPFAIAFCVIGIVSILKKRMHLYGLFAVSLLIAGGLFFIQYAEVTFGKSADFVGHSQQLSKLIYTYASSDYTVYVDRQALPEPHMYIAFWNRIPAKTYHDFQKFPGEIPLSAARPQQLGETILFDEPSVEALACDVSGSDKIVIISSRALDFDPVLVIKDFTRVNTIAYVYTIESIRSDKAFMLSRCKATK